MSASLNECTDMEFYHNLYVQIHQSNDVKLANIIFLLPSGELCNYQGGMQTP